MHKKNDEAFYRRIEGEVDKVYKKMALKQIEIEEAMSPAKLPRRQLTKAPSVVRGSSLEGLPGKIDPKFKRHTLI